jgi:hypothetical protein
MAAARSVQRLRSGFAPTDRDVRHLPALVGSLDVFDLTQSRNLLAHARRVAERSGGRLPVVLPSRNHDDLSDPGPALIQTNTAYLVALHEHLNRHFDAELLQEHYAAVSACTEVLIQHRWQASVQDNGLALAALGSVLRRALGLAMLHQDSVNTVRWESEACEMERQAEALGFQAEPESFSPVERLAQSGWQTPNDQAWHFRDPWQGIDLAGQAVWQGCGLSREGDRLTVQPAWPADWSWWALLDLPIGPNKLSLLWDGATLHATQPVQSSLPVQVHDRINALKTDEYDFDLQFELKSEVDGESHRQVFKPQFDKT